MHRKDVVEFAGRSDLLRCAHCSRPRSADRLSDALRLRRQNLDLASNQIRLTVGKARDKVVWLPLSVELVATFANLKPCGGVKF